MNAAIPRRASSWTRRREDMSDAIPAFADPLSVVRSRNRCHPREVMFVIVLCANHRLST